MGQQSQPKTTRQSMYVTFSAIIASLGGLLFGYDIGIISGAVLQLKEDFQLTVFQQEMVVSSVLIGAFCASFVGGNIVDSWGRKVGIAVSSLLFIVGALLLSFSVSFPMLVIGRFIVGWGISLSVTAECTYISEISLPSRRGMMVSLNEVGITIGFLVAYLFSYLFITTPHGWKYMFGVAAVPAFLQALGVIGLPNSHYYLLIKGKTDEARKILNKLRCNDDVDEEINSILTSIKEQKDTEYRDLFRRKNNMRGRMVLGMMLVFLQQFSGHANVLYYAPTVFQLFGYDNDKIATLVSVGLGVVKVISTIVTLLIVDKVGRKSLLLIGCLLMATSIIILGIVGTVVQQQTVPDSDINVKNANAKNISKNFVFESETSLPETTFLNNKFYVSTLPTKADFPNDRFIANSKTVKETQKNESSIPEMGSSANPDKKNYKDVNLFMKIISVLSLMTFVCAYAMSYGPVTWLVLSEIFPGSLRGRAISVATCINWGSNVVVSLTFLDVLEGIGIGPTFVMYGVICFGAATFIFFCVPETKNKTLEEVDEIMKKGLLQENMKSCSSLCKFNIRS